jgi:hypothetical protein
LVLPAEHPLIMLIAAWQHQPMINGNNGYYPPLHKTRMARLSAFPAPAAIDELAAMHVRLVIIDLQADDSAADAAWLAVIDRARAARPGLILRTWLQSDLRIVELAPPPPGSAPRLSGLPEGAAVREEE